MQHSKASISLAIPNFSPANNDPAGFSDGSPASYKVPQSSFKYSTK